MALTKGLLKIRKINRDLLLLKVAFFIMYGCGGTSSMFILIHLKEHGFNISQLALIYIIAPFVEFATASLCGVIADKIGRSKPVLLGNIFLFTLTLTSFIFVPDVKRAGENTLTSEECCCALQQNATNVYLSDFCNHIFKEYENVTDENDLSTQMSLINTSCDNCYRPVEPLNISRFSTVKFQISQTNSSNSYKSLLAAEKNELPLSSRIIFLTLLMVYIVVTPTSFRFVDVLTMCVTNSFHVDYGKIRFWGILGIVIWSPLFGFLVQISTPTDGPKNAVNAFYLYIVMLLVTIILFWYIRVEDKPPGRKMWKNSLLLVKNIDVLGFFFIILVLGTGYIFFTYYAPLYLDELGASSILLSMVPTVSGLAGLPCLFTSNWWMKRFGHENLLLVALVAYSLMSLGYALLVNVWFVLLIETGQTFSYHLFMVAFLRYSDEIAPPGLTSTVIASAGALHFAIGKATAGLIGRYIMPLGPRWVFGLIGGLTTATAIFGFVFFRIRRKMKQKCFELNKPMKTPEELQVNRVSGSGARVSHVAPRRVTDGTEV